MWPQPSITLGTGKPKPESQHPSSKMGEIKPEEKIKQVDYINSHLNMKQFSKKRVFYFHLLLSGLNTARDLGFHSCKKDAHPWFYLKYFY
jgi:hypothetical protein